MMGDDGEKFGSWPTTWEHCWGANRWVDRFFDALEANAGWLTTVTPSDWLDGNAPIGRVYLPTASYAEMGEWSLPPDESRRFADLLHRAEAAGAPEYRYLRGGFWRNFQVKYREINDLHKQMLRTSAKVGGDARGAGADGRPGPSLPGPVERLLLARPVRGHLHQPHAPGHLRAPDRRGGCRRPGRPRGRRGCRRRPRGGCRPRRRCGGGPRDRGPGRHGQALRGRGDRELGRPGGAPRARGRAAPAAGGVPRDARRARAEARRTGRAGGARRGRGLHP